MALSGVLPSLHIHLDMKHSWYRTVCKFLHNVQYLHLDGDYSSKYEFLTNLNEMMPRVKALRLSFYFKVKEAAALAIKSQSWNLLELRIDVAETDMRWRDFRRSCLLNPHLLYSNTCKFPARIRSRVNWAAFSLVLAFVRANAGHPFHYSILPLVPQILESALPDAQTETLFPRLLRPIDVLWEWTRPISSMPMTLSLSALLDTRFAHSQADRTLAVIRLSQKRKRPR